VTASTRKAAPPTGKEFEKSLGLLTVVLTTLQHPGSNVPRVTDRRVERSKSPLQFIHHLRLQTASTQSDHIQSDQLVALRRKAERRYIARNSGAPTYHGAGAYTAELVDYRSASKEGAISYLDMSGEQGRIRNDDARTNEAIVSHMARGHQETIRSNLGAGSSLRRSTDRHMLANDGPRADAHAGPARRVEAQILRIPSDYGKRMHDDALSEFAVACDEGMSMYGAPRSEARAVLNDCRGMNAHELFATAGLR
jgi:hypothetical protein